jgi:hypothetical protein
MSVVRVLEDGTRVYSNGTRYKPLSAEQRTYKQRKPANPRAVRWKGDWWEPRDLLDQEDRVMPLTRPDSDAYEHRILNKDCNCEVCLRPSSLRWRAKASEERRTRSVAQTTP